MQWYSTKKSIDQTRVELKNILKIDTGTESIKKNKTSISIYYGTSLTKNNHKILNIDCRNIYETLVWSKGLSFMKNGYNGFEVDDDGIKEWNGYMELIGDDIYDEAKDNDNKDDMNAFCIFDEQIKENDLSFVELLKQHNKAKIELQKCVDYVMTKANYRQIANYGQFDAVKYKLENIDSRLREVKTKIVNIDNPSKSELIVNKSRLLGCWADLEALKSKLQALVSGHRKL